MNLDKAMIDFSDLSDEEVMKLVLACRSRRRQRASKTKPAETTNKQDLAVKMLEVMSPEDLRGLLEGLKER